MTGSKFKRKAIFWLIWTYFWTVVFFLYLMWNCLYAQPVAEIFQKQVWPGAAPLSMEAWEIHLPTQGNDTVVDATAQSAEVLHWDARNRPVEVITLRWEKEAWVPETRHQAQYSPEGFIIDLHAWSYTDDAWTPKAWMARKMTPDGHDTEFDFRIWMDGHWVTTHHETAPANFGDISQSAP